MMLKNGVVFKKMSDDGWCEETEEDLNERILLMTKLNVIYDKMVDDKMVDAKMVDAKMVDAKMVDGEANGQQLPPNNLPKTKKKHVRFKISVVTYTIPRSSINCWYSARELNQQMN